MTTRVVVTGGSGFVGRALLTELHARECDVVLLTRHESERDADTVVSWIADQRADVIVHLATHFLASHEPADIPRLVRSNVELGALVGEGAALSGAVVVNTGTAWQHYEGRAFDPVSLYAATKQALTDVLEYYARVRDVDVREVTLFDTYGPGDTRPKLVPALLSAARYGTALPMSDGGQLIDLTYVDDVARGIAEVALAQAPTGPTVLRSWHPITIRQLVAELESAAGVSVPVLWDARPRRDREMREDWRFGQPPPGWSTSVSLAEGLRRTWDQFAAGHA